MVRACHYHPHLHMDQVANLAGTIQFHLSVFPLPVPSAMRHNYRSGMVHTVQTLHQHQQSPRGNMFRSTGIVLSVHSRRMHIRSFDVLHRSCNLDELVRRKLAS